MKLDKEEYYLTSIREETLKIVDRMKNLLPLIKKDNEHTIYMDLLKSLFGRYYTLTQTHIKESLPATDTIIYNTTIDYIVEKKGNLVNIPAFSLASVKNLLSSTTI